MQSATAEPHMIARNLMENSPAGMRIVAGRCKRDGKMVFPLPAVSESDEYEKVLLSPRGKLWSWTVQRFRPKSPPYQGPEEGFKPFMVGYVEFPEGVVVEGRIDALVDQDRMIIGMCMETTIVPAFNGTNGETIYVHAFRPADRATAVRE